MEHLIKKYNEIIFFEKTPFNLLLLNGLQERDK